MYYFISNGREVGLQGRVRATVTRRYENNATEPEIPLPFVKKERKKIEAHYQGLYQRCLSAGRKAEEIPALHTSPASHPEDFGPLVSVSCGSKKKTRKKSMTPHSHTVHIETFFATMKSNLTFNLFLSPFPLLRLPITSSTGPPRHMNSTLYIHKNLYLPIIQTGGSSVLMCGCDFAFLSPSLLPELPLHFLFGRRAGAGSTCGVEVCWERGPAEATVKPNPAGR